MTNILHLAYTIIAFTNVTLQLEPTTNNAGWITNCWGTNLILAGDIQFTAFIGPTVKLWWDEPSTNLFLEWSKDLNIWEDVRVRFLGVTNWLVRPVDSRFYRLRS